MDKYIFTRDKYNELGRGSFSIVYLATYNGLSNEYLIHSTKVAIKIIQTKGLTPKAMDILYDELSIMDIIRHNPHPNIVNCYDIIKDQNEIYIILEYCDSGTLYDLMRKPIKEKYAQYYFCQLVNGLKYLDQQNIIHRDIKPKNILLTNKRKILKIADFGFAKQSKEQSLHETMCGSPLYMAPEILNNNMYNNQTDLWSVGMLLYEILFGFHPYGDCKTQLDLKEMQAGQIIEIPPKHTKNKDISYECLSLVKHLLEKKVTDRITWDGFFNHSWVASYQYDINGHPTKNEEYNKKLASTSLGSFSPPSILTKCCIPIVKMSNVDNLNIVDNFYDHSTSSSPNNVNYTVTMNQSTDDCIFEMDFDKITVKQIMDKSSVLDEDNNDYDVIENNL